MNRTASLDRRHRRILAGGVIASAVVHAALFASLRFEIPIDGHDSEISLVPQAMDVPAETAVLELLSFALTAAPSAPSAEAGAAALPPMGGAPAGAESVAASPAFESVMTEHAAGPAFETLAVVDPMTNASVQPIAFDALPAVTTAAPADSEEDGVQVYVPGSVGKAKRQWARGIGEADAADGRGARIGIIAVGGGHCPMPGRVPVSWGRFF